MEAGFCHTHVDVVVTQHTSSIPYYLFSVGFSCPINRKTIGELAMAHELSSCHPSPCKPGPPSLSQTARSNLNITRRLSFSSCRKGTCLFYSLGTKSLIHRHLSRLLGSINPCQSGLLSPLSKQGILSWAWLCEQSYKPGSGKF